jgi:hypothetical protein
MQVCQICFLVSDPEFQHHSKVEEFEVYTVEDRSSQALCIALNQCNAQQAILLVQFSGYGFAAWGNPEWLIEGLKVWKKKNLETKIVTMFHELNNKLGYPWKHNFWVHHAQKRITTDLALLSHDIVTNLQEYSETLSLFTKQFHQEIRTLPVFSNVAELKENPLISDRQRSLVIFGKANTRRRAYKESTKFIEKICDRLKIDYIIDIGPSTELDFIHSLEIPVIEKGRLEITDVSLLLSQSLAGFINYEVKRLAKSGTFAAYCSHGLIPVVSEECDVVLDNLYPGLHYLVPSNFMNNKLLIDSQNLSDNYCLSQISNRIFDWYQDHNLDAHAQQFSSLIQCI